MAIWRAEEHEALTDAEWEPAEAEFTGDVGVALHLRFCATGDPAFPTIDDL